MLSMVLVAVPRDLLLLTVANVSSEIVVATVSKLKVPDPSVTSACPAVPSDVGRVNATPPEVITTAPVPLAFISKGAFEAFVEIVLSVIVTPSSVEAPVTPNVVETVAAPVTASVEPLKLKLPSAVIADVPVPVRTALFYWETKNHHSGTTSGPFSAKLGN